MAVCSPEGNRGLPLILQGPITPTILNSIKSSSFIELKAAARSTFPSFDEDFVFHESAQTTIRAWGKTFSLQHTQLFKTVNTSFFSTVTPPVAELTLWFKSQVGNQIILLFVPIFIAAKNNSGGEYIAAAFAKDTSYKGSISSVFGQGQGQSQASIHYDTCVACENEAIQTNVITFLDGIQIDSSTFKAFQQEGSLKEFGFPAILLPSTDSLTIMIPPSTYDTSGKALRTVYTTLVSTGCDIFPNRFRYYEKTFIQSHADIKKESTAYKCMPVDARKDLKKIGDKYIISLDTKKQVELEEDKKERNTTSNSGFRAATAIAITIGVFSGAALASGALWIGFRYIVRRS